MSVSEPPECGVLPAGSKYVPFQYCQSCEWHTKAVNSCFQFEAAIQRAIKSLTKQPVDSAP